jgi:transporter family protein
MNAILLTITIVLNLISYGIVRNEFCKKDVKNNSDLNVFNAVSSLVSMVTLTVICAFTSALSVPSMYTVLLGIVFGLSTALCAILNMKALESGPLSYTNVIVSCAMVIPALSGMVLYNETVSVWQIVGIVLMVTSFVCAVDNKNSGSGASLRWLLFCLGAFLFSGAVGVMQKVHQSSIHKDELGMFLIIAFGVSAIFSFCLTAYYKKRNNETVTVLGKKKMRKFVICSVTCGIGIALCNQINMYLAGAMDSIIFYPMVNGASMILTAAAGIILWKERLSKKQWFGLVVGGVAILLLCNIF